MRQLYNYHNFPLSHAAILHGAAADVVQGAFRVWLKIVRGMSRGSFARLVERMKEAQGSMDFDFFELTEPEIEVRLTSVVLGQVVALVRFTAMTPRQRATWLKKNPKGFERVVDWLKWRGLEL